MSGYFVVFPAYFQISTCFYQFDAYSPLSSLILTICYNFKYIYIYKRFNFCVPRANHATI